MEAEEEADVADDDDEEEEEEAEAESLCSASLRKTAPSLATARRVLAAEPPAVTAGLWGSRAARRSALSSTETRLRGSVWGGESEFCLVFGDSGGGFLLLCLLSLENNLARRDTAFATLFFPSACDSTEERRFEVVQAKRRREEESSEADSGAQIPRTAQRRQL